MNSIRSLHLLLPLFFLFSIQLFSQSDFIHVDQFGYLPNGIKVAVLSNPITGYNSGLAYTAPATLEVRNASTNAVVFSGVPTAWNGGATHGDSGDAGWWFDFSSVMTEGNYYVYDPTSGEQSGDFDISTTVYNALLKDAGRMFYYNRCNHSKATPYAESSWTDGMNFMNALQDTNCRFINDPSNASLERDLSGGWFDAGDYNKYVTFAEGVVHDLLWAYEENPSAFGDNWDIPESGNGIPDIIDEVKWEIDWLKKMINADGSVIIKMGSQSHSENSSSPPSANIDQRFYEQTCTSSSISAAGMFAHAAKVYESFPSLAGEVADLTTKAAAAFSYFETALNANNLETNCDDLSIVAGDADNNETAQKESALVAAIHLFDLTSTSSYNTYIVNHINDATPIQNSWWGPYTMSLNSALLHYTSLSGNNSSVESQIVSSITSASTSDFFGFNNNDLYRSYIPTWAYHWGSNRPKSHFAVLNNLLVNYNVNSGNSASYTMKSQEVLHYFHGVNPLGMVMLSNMNQRGADKSVNQLYHLWFADGTDYDDASTSLYGPAPGFVTGGANKDFSVGSISPPSGQPAMKSYLDFNTGWPDNSWEISEPAIYYQSTYIRLLSAQNNNATVLPVSFTSPFQAIAQENKVELVWRVSLEEGADYYEVQHQIKNGIWESLGRVEAANKNRYTLWHQSPQIGANYYRLKQVDLNGKFTYSNIAFVQFENEFSKIKIAPNPLINNNLFILNTPDNYFIKISNIQGKTVAMKRTNGLDLQFDMTDVRKGIYVVEMINKVGEVVWIKKLVRQ